MDALTTEERAEIRRVATFAIEEQVHPDNWSWWVTHQLMGGPARDFIEAASPSLVLRLLDELDEAWAAVERSR